MGCQIGGAVAVSLTPYLASRYGWNAAFIFAALLSFAGGALWLFVDPSRSHSQESTLNPRAEVASIVRR
jgi:dipeptide/tripeptide permease